LAFVSSAKTQAIAIIANSRDYCCLDIQHNDTKHTALSITALLYANSYDTIMLSVAIKSFMLSAVNVVMPGILTEGEGYVQLTSSLS
jgi:hypothetical protein